MSYPAPFDARTPQEAQAVEQARAAAAVARPHRARHDRDGSFPTEGLEALARSGFLALTVPRSLGGEEMPVAPLVLGSLELAKGDSSLALVVAMHLGLLGRTRDAHLWPPDLAERVDREILAARDGNGALINSLATEPEMGSPSRGGLPATGAVRTGTGWRLDGRKTFSTGAPVLRWGVFSAAARDERGDRLASFLVPMASPGIRVEATWDTLGMRATGSHTVWLEGVEVPADAEIPRPVASAGAVPYERAWGLLSTAVYLGVAEAARDFATRFAGERKPSALQGRSIASVPQIRQRVGHLDLLLYQARGLLVSTARQWDAASSAEARIAMDGALAAAKVTASNLAIAIAEEAMRLVGGSSIDRSQPLEQLFRDVRGGVHHPPQDDAALELLARAALGPPD